MAQLSPTMNVMIKAVEKATRSLIRDFGEVENLQVSQKGPGDFVSAADTRAEQIIHDELIYARPDYGFMMEEGGIVEGKDKDYRWIIDPLDGTSNFLHGLPHWSISIALEHKGEIIAGIVHDPVKDEMFHAEKGKGAFVRRQRLRVSGRKSLSTAMIATGEPSRNPNFNAESNALKAEGASMRRFGSAALDMCYVAAGRLECFWERNLKPWDLAAGYIIAKEAGGSVCDLDSDTKNPVFSGNIMASNAELYHTTKQILRKVKA